MNPWMATPLQSGNNPAQADCTTNFHLTLEFPRFLKICYLNPHLKLLTSYQEKKYFYYLPQSPPPHPSLKIVLPWPVRRCVIDWLSIGRRRSTGSYILRLPTRLVIKRRRFVNYILLQSHLRINFIKIKSQKLITWMWSRFSILGVGGEASDLVPDIPDIVMYIVHCTLYCYKLK